MERMEDMKAAIAGNIIALRTGAGMTQLELAERLNYSDKSVSKWERGEALPDVYVLKSIGEIFGVTVDYLLTPSTDHDAQSAQEERIESSVSEKKNQHSAWHRTVIGVALVGIWTLALLIFIIFWLSGHIFWLIFIGTIPVSLITLLVLHTIWGKGQYNFYIISALVFSILGTVYLSFYRHNWWQIFLLVIPAELVVYLCFRIKRTAKPNSTESRA